MQKWLLLLIFCLSLVCSCSSVSQRAEDGERRPSVRNPENPAEYSKQFERDSAVIFPY